MPISGTDVLQLLGGNAVIGAAFLLYLRHLLQGDQLRQEKEAEAGIKRFESELRAKADTDLKRFEIGMKARADRSIEELKSALQMAAFEHQVRFSSLHQRRAESIAALYGKVVAAHRLCRDLVFGVGDEALTARAMYETAVGSVTQAREYFENDEIYYPDSVCRVVKGFLSELLKVAADIGAYIDVRHGSADVMTEKAQARRDSWHRVDKELPAAREVLRREFRRVLDGGQLPPIEPEAGA